MTQHFNGLDEADAEALALLAEEAGEIVQAAMKCLRHGLRSHNPLIDDGVNDPPTNGADLSKEIGQLYVAIGILINAGVLSKTEIEKARDAKMSTIGKWLHHARVNGRAAEGK